MNKLLIAAFLVLLSYVPLTYANEYHNNKPLKVECSPQLQKKLDAIQKIPEANQLISAIQKEGTIRIVAKNTGLSNQFGAFWDPDHRVICVALSSDRTDGDIIGSMLFELHNASVNSKFNQLDALASSGKISKDRFVESMEYLEYVNSHNAAKIAEKGVRMGVLPQDAVLQTYPNFEKHFAVQKQYGHSAWFAKTYDMIRNDQFQSRT